MTPTPNLFLKRVLLLDAVASGATGLLLFAGAGLLQSLLQIDPAIARPAGLFLLPWAAAVAWLGLRADPGRGLVTMVIAVNVLWTVESVLTLALGWLQPNGLGVAFVLAQAAAVGGFAALQAVGLRRMAAA